jgi:hypothetical protein
MALLFNGYYFTYEQKLLNQYYIHPLEVVGYEGLFGLAISTLVVIIVSFVPCSFGLNACVYNDEGYPFIEQPVQYVN